MRDAQHEGVVMDRHTIPISPELGESAIPLAGWTIRIVPKDLEVTDSEYEAGLAAIEDYGLERGFERILAAVMDDERMRGFTVTME